MNVLIFSDLHLHKFPRANVDSNGNNELVVSGLDIIDQVYKYAIDNNILEIIFLGDLFHNRSHIDTDVYSNLLFKKFEQYTSPSRSFTIIPGNHDQINKEGTHGLYPFKLIDNVFVIDKMTKIKNSIYCPHQYYLNDLYEFLKRRSDKNSIVFMHQLLMKSPLMNAHINLFKKNEAVDVTQFEYKYLFSGHNHRPFEDKEKHIYNVGSPRHYDFGDVECPERFFIHFDDGNIKWVPTVFPSFADQGSKDAKTASYIRKKTKKVIIADKRVDMKFTDDDTKILTGYVNNKQNIGDKKSLINIGLNILSTIPLSGAGGLTNSIQIDLLSLEIFRFKSIKTAFIKLNDRGTVGIRGVNNDKTGSNGSGKSTIPVAILWCLYGRTFAGKEAEKDIMSKFGKKKDGCYVRVIFIRNDVTYRVSRYLKHEEHKNNAVIEKLDGVEYTNISKCTNAEVNDQIINTIGADFDSFVYLSIFSFNSVVPFLSLSDKDKKELILPRYLTERFRLAYKKCVDKLGDIDDQLSLKDREKLVFETKLSGTEDLLYSAQKEIDDQILIAERAKVDLKKAEEDKRTYEKNIKSFQYMYLQYERDLSDSQKIYDVILAKLDEYRLKDAEITNYALEISKMEASIANKRLELSEHMDYSKDDSEILLAALSSEGDKVGKKYIDCEGRYKLVEEEYTKTTKIRSSIESSLNVKVLELTEADNDVIDSKLKLDTEEFKLAEFKNQRDSLSSTYYSKECEKCLHSKYSEVFKSLNTKISNQEKLIENYKSIEIAGIVIKRDNIRDDVNKLTELSAKCDATLNRIKTSKIDPINTELTILSCKLHDIKEKVANIQVDMSNSSIRANKADLLRQDISNLDSKLSSSKCHLESLKNNHKKTEVTDDQRDNLHSSIQVLEKNMYEANSVFNQETIKLKGIDGEVRKLKELTKVADELYKKKDVLEEGVENIKLSIKGTENQINRLIRKRDDFLFWKTGFSPAGIEGYMLDMIIDNLNTLIETYLGYLSSSTISLALIPESTLKSGDTRNKISVRVDNDFGSGTYKGSSAGEQRIMDISVLFALKSIYETITGSKYNTLFMDEAFTNLDSATCGLVVSLIGQLDTISSIFVVSHLDSIYSEFDSFIEAQKTKGITIIEESNV